MAGFGFEGYDDEGKALGWGNVSNMDVVNFELASNVAEASKAWNKGKRGSREAGFRTPPYPTQKRPSAWGDDQVPSSTGWRPSITASQPRSAAQSTRTPETATSKSLLTLRPPPSPTPSGTQKWLQRYVYQRTNDSVVATYFVSAFWHGFYPGYYLFFFSVASFTDMMRSWQKKVSARFPTKGPIAATYHLVSIVFFQIFINYFSMVFQLLSGERSLLVWASYYYWGHIVALLGIVFVAILPTPRSKEAQKKKSM